MGVYQQDVKRKSPQNTVCRLDVFDDLAEVFRPFFDDLDALRNIQDFKLVLGEFFDQVLDILHGDTDVPLGAAIENDDFHWDLLLNVND